MNFDSGKICSTVFTLSGLLAAPGVMASTRVLSRVQEVDSRIARISGVRGSEEELPHRVPEHPALDPVGMGGATDVTPGPALVETRQ